MRNLYRGYKFMFIQILKMVLVAYLTFMHMFCNKDSGSIISPEKIVPPNAQEEVPEDLDDGASGTNSWETVTNSNPENHNGAGGSSASLHCSLEDGARTYADCDGNGLIEITSIVEFNQIRFNLLGTSWKTNASSIGNTTGCPLHSCFGYELTQNITFAGSIWDTNNGGGEIWQPIGDSVHNFNATLNGNGYTISNLMIHSPSLEHAGLFGYLGALSVVKNLGLLDADILCPYTIGSKGILAGSSYGLISNVYVRGSIIGGNFTGGIVGLMRNGGLNNAYAKIIVSGNTNVGGLVGDILPLGYILNSYSIGTVTGGSQVGGIIGKLNPGLAGYPANKIKDSFTLATVSGTNAQGSLVGVNSGYLEGKLYYTNSVGDNGVGQNFGGSCPTTICIQKTQSDLYSLTSTDPIYTNLSAEHWDFSNKTNDNLPSLRTESGERILGQ